MKRLLIVLPLLCLAVHAEDIEGWKVSLIKGELGDDGFVGTGRAITTKMYGDFALKLEAVLKGNPEKCASLGILWGVPEQDAPDSREYQLFIRERDIIEKRDVPVIYLNQRAGDSDKGPNQLWKIDLPKRAFRRPLKISVAQKQHHVRIQVGRVSKIIRLPHVREGYIRLLALQAPITVENIVLKEL